MKIVYKLVNIIIFSFFFEKFSNRLSKNKSMMIKKNIKNLMI